MDAASSESHSGLAGEAELVIGIVGHEEKKFTKAGRDVARGTIALIITRAVLEAGGPIEIVSGGCHLGGIDIWAAEIGHSMNQKVTEFVPAVHNWTFGYMPRNMEIARASDVVHSIVVDKLPPDFGGMTHKLCYYCGRTDHVKSGGCWTMKQAMKMGKQGVVHVIKNL